MTPPQSPTKQRHNRHRKNAPSFDSSVASLTETETIVANLFCNKDSAPLRLAEDCTFNLTNKSVRLKEGHIRKVQKYAKRRLERMHWHVLKDTCDYTLPTPKSHADVQIGELLGEGSFSSVYARKEYPQHVVKVLRTKLVNNPPMFAACAADLVKEGWLLSLVAGTSNVVQIHGWQKHGLQTLANGRHDGFFLVLERLEFTLSDKMEEWQTKKSKLSSPFSSFRRNKKKNETGQAKLELLQERLQVIPDVARGIASLHEKGVMHRDLKPDNIGYKNGVWKIFDLDVAQLCPTINVNECYSEEFKMTKRVGSPRYMSPECARGERYNCLSDVYSFGLLIHEILTCEKPYEDVPSELHDDLVFYEHRRPPISNGWPISMKYLLDSAWHRDWQQRPIISDESFHSSLVNRILPEFLQYKQLRYCPTKNNNSSGDKSTSTSTFEKKTAGGGFFKNSFRNNKDAGSVTKNTAPVDEMGSSLSTTMTTSSRTDLREANNPNLVSITAAA